MEYFLENDYLKVTVTTFGAQVKSVVRKCDGVEHMWKADRTSGAITRRFSSPTAAR